MAVCFANHGESIQSHNLTVLTVSTKESPRTSFWEKTAKQHGYTYEILCRGQQWGGWKWRTAQYLNRLSSDKRAENQIYMLVDCDDVFFAGSSAECVEKFVHMRTDVVVGAEFNCCNGSLRYDIGETAKVKNYLAMQLPNTNYRYPNGGFVMGYRDSLINTLCGIKEYDDDQMGYTLLLARDISSYKLDYERQLCAVITYNLNLSITESEIVESGQWTAKNNRLYHVDTQVAPCVLHFSGSANTLYNIYARKLYNVRNALAKEHTLLESMKRFSFAVPSYLRIQ